MKSWEVRDGSLSWSSLAPPEPQHDETLVKVAFSGVCGSDLAKITKRPIPTPGRTWRPGHEVVGWDVGGPNAPLVVVDPLIPCEDCAVCEKGASHLCPTLRRLGWDLPGGFAEFVAAPRRNIWRLPEGTDPTHAVLTDALAVAIHGIRCGLERHSGGSLAIIGSGPLALCSAAYAAVSGWSVTVVVRNESRLAAIAPHIDARLTLLPEVSRARFDAVVDAANGQNDLPLDTALSLVREGGTVLVQNAYDPGVRLAHDLRDIFRRSVTLIGSFSYCRQHGLGDFREALDVLAGRPRWAAPLVNCRFPLHALPAAVAAITSGAKHARPIKAVLAPVSTSLG